MIWMFRSQWMEWVYGREPLCCFFMKKTVDDRPTHSFLVLPRSLLGYLWVACQFCLSSSSSFPALKNLRYASRIDMHKLVDRIHDTVELRLPTVRKLDSHLVRIGLSAAWIFVPISRSLQPHISVNVMVGNLLFRHSKYQ